LCTQHITVCGGFSRWACGRVSICTDCTTQPFSICGTSPGQCTDCTTQAFSICGTTPGVAACTDCTTQAFSICGTTPGQCTDCTTQAFSICGTSPQAGAAAKCTDCTRIPFSICGTTPARQPGGLTQESIKQLRTHLEQQLAALDEAEKAIGPQTDEEFDAREQELNQELEKLRSRREERRRKE
jgi:hypothetical protein